MYIKIYLLCTNIYNAMPCYIRIIAIAIFMWAIHKYGKKIEKITHIILYNNVAHTHIHTIAIILLLELRWHSKQL